MLILEQGLTARHVGRGIYLRARLYHGVQARGWRMKFSLIKAVVEIDCDPETYKELARRLKNANVHVRPARRCISGSSLSPKSIGSPGNVGKPLSQPALMPSPTSMKPLYCQDGGDVKVNSPPCHSPGAILPDLPQNTHTDDPEKAQGLTKEASANETQAWLTVHRFTQHMNTFANFSGADLLRLSRDDIIQICGLADGIRLYNALHAKRIEPRLTIYVCPLGSNIYSALYLHACHATELMAKLKALLQHQGKEYENVLLSGPNGARVRLSDELVRHLPDNSTYSLERADDALLLCATN